MGKVNIKDFREAIAFYSQVVEHAIPVEQLSSLQATCCPMEPGVMLRAALVIVRFYQELAPLLARTYGIIYPAELERVMSDRLEKLRCKPSGDPPPERRH